MKDLITKIYEEKMENGDFEKIVSERLDHAIKRQIDDLLGYSGAVRKLLELKLTSVMSDLIEKSDFANYVEKIKFLINDSVKGSSLEEYKTVTEQLSKLVGRPKYDNQTKKTINELFELYCNFATEHLENVNYEDYVDNPSSNVEEGQVRAMFNFSVEVEESERYFGEKDLTVVFKTTHDETDEEVEYLTTAFKLWKIGNTYTIHYGFEISKDLLHLNDFEIEIIALKNTHSKIEVDTTMESASEVIYWDFEY